MNNSIWIDTRLNEEEMNFLNVAISEENKKQFEQMIGEPKSELIKDKDNWFYETVLKKLTERMFYRDWNNYYRCHIEKKESPLPKFEMNWFWVNYMKQHEFNPLHAHSGLYSFVVFMKIPTYWKEQHALSFSANSAMPLASDFVFMWSEKGTDIISKHNFPLNPEDEGRMLFFPASLQHEVFPFYGTEEERITISGNIVDVMYTNPKIQIDALDKEIENLQKQKEQLKQRAKELKNINFHIK